MTSSCEDNKEKRKEEEENLFQSKQLLEAITKKDLSQTQLLLATANVQVVSHEFYHEGVWGAHKRESLIHHALFNLCDTLYSTTSTDEEIRLKAEHDAKSWRDVVVQLIQKGASVNAAYEDYDWRGCGRSQKAFELLLSWILPKNDWELLSLSLQHGGNSNLASISETHSMRTDGRSIKFPIHTTVSQLSYDCTKVLLDARANVDAISSAIYHNERGYNQERHETALHIAILTKTNNNEDVDENNMTKTLLEQKKNQLRVLLLLLEAGANVNAVRSDLVQEDLDVTSPTNDPRDPAFIPSVRCVHCTETPLLMAIRLNRPDIVRMLRSYGADLSASYQYGQEPPKSAWKMAQEKDAEMVEALQCQWKPQYHSLYAPHIQREIFLCLCVALRQAWPLPNELMHLILQWIGSPPFPARIITTTQQS